MNPRDSEATAVNPAPPPPPEESHTPAPVDLAEESVAGEEDPGASLDEGVGWPAPVPAPGDPRR